MDELFAVKYVTIKGQSYVTIEEVQAALDRALRVGDQDRRAAVEKALDDAWERNG